MVTVSKARKGLTLIECLIALLLLAITVVGGMSFYFHSNQYLRGSIYRRLAAEIANAQMEQIKRNGFAGLPAADGLWTSQTIDIGGLTGGGTQNVYVYDVDSGAYKHVLIETDWQEPGQTTQERVRLDTHIAP
jgi:prepilin-type N-terminal cleavage/methylation domain-containing protein